MVPENPTHAVKQLGRCQQERRISGLVHAVEEKLCVLVSLGSSPGKPFPGFLRTLIWNGAISGFGGKAPAEMAHSLKLPSK